MNWTHPAALVAHDDGLLMADVVRLNEALGRYVLRFLDADTGSHPHVPIKDERALAERLTSVADGMLKRAIRREREIEPSSSSAGTASPTQTRQGLEARPSLPALPSPSKQLEEPAQWSTGL